MLRGWSKAEVTLVLSDAVRKWMDLGGGLAVGKVESP